MADDTELYEAAIADEPPAEAQAEPEAPAVAERSRDELGRFAKPETQEQPEPEPQPEPEEKRADHRVPLMELLNERERRQEEQRRAEALYRELEQLRQQLQPPTPQTPPDQFQDPEAYNNFWEQRFQQQQAMFQQSIRSIQAENSLARAHDKHGDVFMEAYKAIQDRAAQGDRLPAQQVVNSPNPGEAMVNWYKRESTLQTVGNDPEAFAAKLLQEALDNPEFLAKALEKARGVAGAQPTQQIKFPPSLNKATSAARSDDMTPMSDAQMYQYAIGR